MKNKFLIGTVAFVAVLAAIGILTFSFSMTPVLANDTQYGNNTLIIGCTVAISLPDNSSSGGNGSEDQEAFDNSWLAAVYSSDYTTTLGNLNWQPALPGNPPGTPDSMTVQNVGNDWVRIQVALLSDNGIAHPTNSFTGTEYGVFALNAYGNPGTSCAGAGSVFNFTNMGVAPGPSLTMCPALDWHPGTNQLVINDRWTFGTVTADTYNFFLRITATDVNCIAPPVIPVATLVLTTDTGTILAAASNENNFQPVEPGTIATLTGPILPAGNLIDVATLADNISLPLTYTVVGQDAGQNASYLYTPGFDVVTQTFFPDSNGPVILTNVLPGDTPAAVASDNGDFGASGTGKVFLVMAGAAPNTWNLYRYTAINPSSNTATPVSSPTAISGIPNGATVIGFGYSAADAPDGVLSYTLGGLSYVGILTNVLSGSPALTNTYVSQVPVNGLAPDWDGMVLGLTAAGANTAYVEAQPLSGFAATDMYIVTSIGPIDSIGGNPLGLDWLQRPPGA